jgi:hypothetical protein
MFINIRLFFEWLKGHFFESYINFKRQPEAKIQVAHGCGQGGMYAMLEHSLQNGDIWVRCLRCGRCWKPIDSDYKEALIFSNKQLGDGFIELYREETKLS